MAPTMTVRCGFASRRQRTVTVVWCGMSGAPGLPSFVIWNSAGNRCLDGTKAEVINEYATHAPGKGFFRSCCSRRFWRNAGCHSGDIADSWSPPLQAHSGA